MDIDSILLNKAHNNDIDQDFPRGPMSGLEPRVRTSAENILSGLK